MSLRNRFAVACLVLGLLGALVAPVIAQQPGGSEDSGQTERGPRHRRGGRGDMGVMRMLRELDLTEAQQQQARSLVENYLAAIKPQREELFRLREQKEQGANEADLHDRAKALREQIRESAKNMRTQLLAILTPDQRAKLDQMESEFKARREQMRERRRTRQENEQP